MKAVRIHAFGGVEALDLKDATLVGRSTGGGEAARPIGRHGTNLLRSPVIAREGKP